MNRMDDCLDKAMKLDGLDPARAEEAKAEYRKRRDEYLRMNMPEEVASARAAADLKEATRKKQQARFHKVMHQLKTMRKIKMLVDSTPNPANAIKGFLRYAEGHGFKGEGIEKLTEAWTEAVNFKMQDVARAAGLNMRGVSRDAKLLDEIQREAFGEATGNPQAAAFAKVIAETEDWLVRSFNQRGGNIQILKNRGLPQGHDADELMKQGPERWKAYVETRLDWSRIEDHQTGKPFVAEKGQIPPREQSDRFLQEVYDGITTRGWDDRDPSMAMGGKALYNQRAEHRVLHFKDAVSQREYNKTFGGADPFSAILNSMHGLARDIAHMEVLGPNPKLGLEYAIQTAQARAAELLTSAATDAERKQAQKVFAQVKKRGAEARGILAETSGQSSATAYVTVSRFFKGVRSYQVSVQLGSAVLSSVTDFATMGLAAATVGMNPANVLSRSVTLMASQASQQTAARMGYVAETLTDTASGMARWFGPGGGAAGIMDRLAGFTLRASGLNFVTDMRKIAFQMEFSGYMADNAARGFDDLDAGLRQVFEARNITREDWEALRHPSGRFWTEGDGKGADFISPLYWLETQTVLPRDQAEALARKVQMAMREQLEYAVPTSAAEARAFIQQGVDPGSVVGIILKSAGSYKGFAGTLMLNQYRRFVNLPTGADKAKYIFMFMVPGVMLGALAVQLKELAKGNDPRPMDNLAFWGAAFLQFGGIGILGDLLFSDTTRAGGGGYSTLLGPTVGLAENLRTVAVSNGVRAFNGEKTTLGRDFANFVTYGTPVFSSLWPGRAAFSRIFGDALHEFLDPEAARRMQQAARKQQREYGNASYWPRGSILPDRAPDFSNALGGN